MKRLVLLGVASMVLVGIAFLNTGISKNAEIIPPEPMGVVSYM